jgi:hypothetical protein
MTETIKIGDTVRSEYVNRQGKVIAIEEYQPMSYDLDLHKIVPSSLPAKTYYKVLCDLLTLDTLVPCTEVRSFDADALVLVEVA